MILDFLIVFPIHEHYLKDKVILSGWLNNGQFHLSKTAAIHSSSQKSENVGYTHKIIAPLIYV